MKNTNNAAYGLTALFPIKKGMCGRVSRKEALRVYLAGLPSDQGSPFARSAKTHFSRFVVIDDFAYGGEPTLVDTLQSAYLMWTACFNGDLQPWLNTIWVDMHEELQTIFEHCVAYEQSSQRAGFYSYVKRCQISNAFLFADYPHDTLEEVLEGLKLKKHFVAFMSANQQMDAISLKANFDEWVQTMDATPSPLPGSTY